VGVAAANWALAAVLFKLGHFPGDNPGLLPLRNMLTVIVMFANAFLIAAVVHTDPLPGVRQDWLVRPIKRADLLLAKFVFVLLVVHASMLAANVAEAWAKGFSLSQSFEAAASHSLYWLIGFSIPVFAFASLASSWTELVIAGVATFMAVAGFEMLGYTGPFSQQFDPTARTGVGWMTESLRFSLILLGSIAVLIIQYFRRKTMFARWLAAGVGMLCLLTQFFPWRPAFALEERLSSKPGTGSSISVAFDAALGRYQNPSGLSADELNFRRYRGQESDQVVRIPLRISGIPDDAVLKTDRAEIRLISVNGRVTSLPAGDDLQIFREGANTGDERVHEGIHIPATLYSRLQEEPMRVEIDYSLTVWRLGASYSIPALGGDERIPGFGWCVTRMNGSGTTLQLRCMTPGAGPRCLSGFLEHAPSRRRNPETFGCNADYSPYFGSYDPDSISRGGLNVQFRDPRGLAHYPVTGPQLPESRFVVRLYDPQDHFARHLVIPGIRLKDWAPE
jgi:hypothetical protein